MNINGDELSSRIFIYMPIDEAKAFKKKKNKIGMKIKMKLKNYTDSKIERLRPLKNLLGLFKELKKHYFCISERQK